MTDFIYVYMCVMTELNVMIFSCSARSLAVQAAALTAVRLGDKWQLFFAFIFFSQNLYQLNARKIFSKKYILFRGYVKV